MSRNLYSYHDVFSDFMWRLNLGFDRCFVSEMPQPADYLSWHPTERSAFVQQLADEAVGHFQWNLKRRVRELEAENMELQRRLDEKDEEWHVVNNTTQLPENAGAAPASLVGISES